MSPVQQVLLRLAAAVAVLAAPVLVGAWQVEPVALGHVGHLVGETPGASIPWDGRPIAAYFLHEVAYNATRDATLAGALLCSHDPCGPLVWVRGNDTGRGPFVLRTDARRLTVEDVTPPGATASDPQGPASGTPRPVTPPSPQHGPRPSLYDRVDAAIAEPFTVEPALPYAIRASLLVVAPLPLLALAPQEVAWWRRGLVLAGVAAGWTFAFVEREETWGLLVYGFLVVLLAAVAGLALVVLALARRRLSPEALAVLGFAVAFLAAIGALTPYFPVEGGE